MGKSAEALESLRRGLAIRQKLVDDNPAVTDFRLYVADSHNGIGIVQSDRGKPVEAMESYGRALAIYRKLADDNPAVARIPIPHGEQPYESRIDPDANRKAGRGRRGILTGRGNLDEAGLRRIRQCQIPGLAGERPEQRGDRPPSPREARRGASPVREGDRAEAGAREGSTPENLVYRDGLGESHLRSGLARRDEGDTAGAVTDWRQSDALLEGIGELGPEYDFLHACCHSSLSWAAGRPGSGVSAGDAEAEAAKAAGTAPACGGEWASQPRLPTATRPPSTRSATGPTSGS